MELTSGQWRRIHEAQSAEISALLGDRKFAAQASQMPHFSRVGAWLAPATHRRVLEVGCGPGRYVALLASLGFDVVGVDPTSYPSWQMLTGPNIELHSAVFAEDLPFPDCSFDAIACMGALLYFDDLDRAFREMRRVLKPAGRIVLRTVNRANLYTSFTGAPIDPAGGNLFTSDELVQALTCRRFRVGEIFSYGFYPPVALAAWWYLSNCTFPYRLQQTLSRMTPAKRRVNLVAFACTCDQL
jgi:SAM-dependent methyltransferase